MAQPTIPPWIQTLQQRDAQFAESYLAQRERILQDGAIPAKYKILMTMIVDALTAHADGVANIANRARAVGATEAEINETVEVAYLFGGTPALVTAVNVLIAAGFSIAGLVSPKSILPAGSVPGEASFIFAMYAAARSISMRRSSVEEPVS